MRSKPPAEAPPPTAWMTSESYIIPSFILILKSLHLLPSQQSVRRLLRQHRGCCHATVAHPQVLDDVSPRNEGDAHRSGDDADVILPARRLFEGGDELSLKRKDIKPPASEYSSVTLIAR